MTSDARVAADLARQAGDLLLTLRSASGLTGKDLGQYSLETVQMFAEDAAKSGFTL